MSDIEINDGELLEVLGDRWGRMKFEADKAVVTEGHLYVLKGGKSVAVAAPGTWALVRTVPKSTARGDD